jgi:SAM-dependent methyltransferase
MLMFATLRRLTRRSSPPESFPAICEKQSNGTFVVRCEKCGEELATGISRRALHHSAGLLAKHSCLALSPIEAFHSPHYLRLNARQLEHFATLGISVRGMRVLEVGAGIGDHTHYFLDRDCDVTLAEGRAANVEILRELYPHQAIVRLNLESPTPVEGAPFDVVYCSGLLYHLQNPAAALEFLSTQSRRLFILQTCVSFGAEKSENLITEPSDDPTQALSGRGCRPTRPWLFEQLQNQFEHVYCPVTQPNHEEFPLDWTSPEKHHSEKGLQRSIFIASRAPIDNPLLRPELLNVQSRHS